MSRFRDRPLKFEVVRPKVSCLGDKPLSVQVGRPKMSCFGDKPLKFEVVGPQSGMGTNHSQIRSSLSQNVPFWGRTTQTRMYFVPKIGLFAVLKDPAVRARATHGDYRWHT